jgi:hypothetical protein
MVPENEMNKRPWTNSVIPSLLALALPLLAMGQTAANVCAGKKLPRFEEHPAATDYNGKPHVPILATALDRMHRTIIGAVAAHGVTFAGQFTLVRWGVGTGLQEFVIVDLKTGRVYDPPFQGVGLDVRSKDFDPPAGWQCYSDLLTYRRDSNLLVVEGCLLRGNRCGRTYLVIEAGGLTQVAFDPDPRPSNSR